jgi:hypothetical protein
MNHVANRLAYWPNATTRAEAARLFYVEGMSLAMVLARYPDEVVTARNGVLRGAARRAIWAHYALVQEAVGEPDINPEDHAAIALLVSESTVPTGCIRYAVAECRTGSHLGEYNTAVPDLGWYRKQAPSSWPVDAPDDEERAERELAKLRSDRCPNCFEVHAGECA